MDDLQAVFGASSSNIRPSSRNRYTPTASPSSSESLSSSSTATPIASNVNNNNRRRGSYRPRDLIDDEEEDGYDAPIPDLARGAMRDNVDVFPLADLLGPMGDNIKELEQQLDDDLPSFQGNNTNSQSTFSETSAAGRGLGGGSQRPNLFSQQQQQQTRGGGQQRYPARRLRSSSPANSALDPKLHAAADTSYSTISSVEYGRGAQPVVPSFRIQSPSRSHFHNTRNQSATYDGRDDTRHIGASPASTAGHHVSKLSNGLGPSGWMAQGGAGKRGSKGKGGFWEDENGDGEYDKDRSMRVLLDELERAGSGKENSGPSHQHLQGHKQQKSSSSANLQPTSTRPNVFAPQPTTSSSNNNLAGYKPIKPSPLKQATHHNNSSRRTVSGSSAMPTAAGGSLRAEHGPSPAVSGTEGPGYPYQDTPVPVRGRRSTSSSLLVGGGNGNGYGSEPVTAGRASNGNNIVNDNGGANSTPQQRVRIVSDPDTKAKREGALRPKSMSAAYEQGGMRKSDSHDMELTRLTDLCRTPGKGDSFVGVGENAAAPGSGARIPRTLHDVNQRMKALENDCAQSKRRVQELEVELEQARAEADEMAREGEDRRVREVASWRMRYEMVKKEKEDLEKLLASATTRIAELERQQRHTAAEVSTLRQELKIQLTPRKARPAPAAERADMDLRLMVEHVIQRLESLEGNVSELRVIVDEAIDFRMHAKAERSFAAERQGGLRGVKHSAPPAVRPSSRTQSDPGRPLSQYEEGVRTAAYDGKGASRKAHFHATVETDTDGGESSPTPLPSLASRSMLRADKHMRERQTSGKQIFGSTSVNTSVSFARSDEPQDDPSMEAFPAIRGDRLEKEFFSSPNGGFTALGLGERKSSGRHAKASAPPAMETRRDSGSASDKAAKLESAIKHGGDRLPSVTHIVDLLKEIEDDFNHYLGIYTELADQYKRMHPTSPKRNILAEHLKDVIDTMEAKANQVARLTEVLDAPNGHKSYKAPTVAVTAARASRKRMMVPEGLDSVMREIRGQKPARGVELVV